MAVEQEMETFGEKEEKGKVRFLISLDISQSREVKHRTDAGRGGGGRCTLRVVINLARHAFKWRQEKKNLAPALNHIFSGLNNIGREK